MDGVIPLSAIYGGREAHGESLYVARARYQVGSSVLSFQSSDGLMHILDTRVVFVSSIRPIHPPPADVEPPH